MSKRVEGRCSLMGQLLFLALIASKDLSAQTPIPVEGLPPELQVLARFGDLRLRTASIHGTSPLVVLLTEAFPEATEAERKYRRRFTEALVRGLGDAYSLFVLKPGTPSKTLSVQQIRSRIDSAFDAFFELHPMFGPQAFIGFAETAPEAGELLIQYPYAAAVIALVPSSAQSLENWEVTLRRLGTRQPWKALLVIESVCNNSASWLSTFTVNSRDTLITLPGHDNWLARKSGTGCPATPDHSTIEKQFHRVFVDWLNRYLYYPT